MSVGNAVENVANVLGVAGSITTLISLAALSLLIAYLLAGRWLRGKSDAAQKAIDKSDDAALARLLGGTSVPLDTLSPEQKFALASEDLRTRKQQRIIAHALIFFAFLALLAFAFALAAFSPEPAPAPAAKGAETAAGPERIDVLRALDILRLVPQEGRAQACANLLSQEDCTRAAPMIAALAYEAPTPRQSQVLEQALERGTVTPVQVQALDACGGSYDFRIENNRLLCADGSPVPSVANDDEVRPLAGAPVAIVFHATGTPNDSSFAGVAQLIALGRPDLRGPLAHILISRSGAVIQTAPLNQMAFHVGASSPWDGVPVVNSNAIGVEMINQTSGVPYSNAQIEAAKGVVRALVRAYGIRAVVGHSEVARPAGRKADPGPLFPIGEMRAVAVQTAR